MIASNLPKGISVAKLCTNDVPNTNSKTPM